MLIEAQVITIICAWLNKSQARDHTTLKIGGHANLN